MDNLLSLLLFVAFIYLMMRYGCGGHMRHGHRTHRNGETPDESAQAH